MSWFGPLLAAAEETSSSSGTVETSVPIWGDGRYYGDGSVYTRLYGSNPYIVDLEHAPQRVSIEVKHEGSQFVLDRLSLIARVEPEIERRFQAYFHESVGQRIGIEVAHSGYDFTVDRLTLVGHVLPQQEYRFQATYTASVGERVSLETAYSGGGDFRVLNLRVIGQVLKKQHQG